ncbi:MAG: PIN domain-containing protein [Thermoplasmata archaeon]|nr:PIN domain-containing protein [Thermoplasmata archaeon]
MEKERKKGNEISGLKLYIDTNVLQGVLSRRNKEVIILLDRIKSSKLTCTTSILTVLELLDIAKDREFLIKLIKDKWADVSTFLRERKNKNLTGEELKNLSDKINNLFLEYNFIEIINIKEDDWELVKKICQESNLHSTDAIHLVTAWVGGCRYLITYDNQFIAEGNRILEREKVLDKLSIITASQMLKLLEGASS